MAVTGTEIGSVSILKGNAANLPTLADGVLAVTEDTKKLYVGTTTGNARVAMATQENIIAPTLLNSWINFGSTEQTAGYYKDDFGIVHLQGTIKSGTATLNIVLFALPVGYRPLKTERYPVYSNDGFSTGTVAVDFNGNVTFISGSNLNFSLSGVSFRTT